MVKALLAAVALVVACGPAQPAAVAAAPVTVDPLEARIHQLLARMTLEQKVGQMIQAEIAHVTPADIRRYRLGSVLNGGGSFPGGRKSAPVADWLALADALYDASVSPVDEGVAVPIIWGTDAVHGHNNVRGATLFPHNIGLGAARDPDLVERIGRAVAREVAATGIDWVFAPTIAVARDDRWGRTYESFAEHPPLVSDLGTRMVAGLQDGDPGVIATAKHFIGDGGTVGGKDQGNTLASSEELLAVHAPGYRSAIAAGVRTVMATFNSVNGVKVHGSEELLTGLLKRQLGFDGLVVSDWNGIGQVPGCTNDSCPKAINAGVDVLMAPDSWKALYRNTLSQVRSGEIPIARIDDAVTRILRVKLRAGVFEQGRPSSRAAARTPAIVGAPSHRELAREAVRKSLVLLKNRGALIPLAPRSRILVLGDGADNVAKQAGGWSVTWQGTGNSNEDFPGATSVLAGIRQTVASAGGSVVTTPPGTGDPRVDAAIVVFGEEPYAEGEGDRADLVYSSARPGDLALLRQLRASGIPVVSVFLTGRPLWINPELNASDAFVVAWLPGTEGAGVADLLFRDVTGKVRHEFVGRLPFSWPGSPRTTPINVGGPQDDVLFPYGHGLTTTAGSGLPDALPEQRDLPASAARVLKIFDRRPVAPWQLIVGDAANWRMPLPATEGASRQGVVTVALADKNVQGDARKITWNGAGQAQVYFQADSASDFSAWLAAKSALWIDLRVDTPPVSAVSLRMDCGYPCGARADVTRPLKSVPRGEWVRMSVDLKCFADTGTDMKRVDTPMLLSTTGKLGLTIAAVTIVPGAGPEAAVSCSRGR